MERMLKAATSDPRNAAVTETQLNDISEEVGNCWKDVGIKLGISAAKIKNIDEENRINREKALAILIGWKWMEGRNATVGKLADVLKTAERKDIAEKLLGPEAIDCELEVCEREGNVSFGAAKPRASKYAAKREDRTAKPKQRVTPTPTGQRTRSSNQHGERSSQGTTGSGLSRKTKKRTMTAVQDPAYHRRSEGLTSSSVEYKSQPRKQFGPARRAIPVLSGDYASEAACTGGNGSFGSGLSGANEYVFCKKEQEEESSSSSEAESVNDITEIENLKSDDESSSVLYDNDDFEEEIVEEIDEEFPSDANSTLTAVGGASSVSSRNVVAEGKYDDDSFEDDSGDEEREDDRTEPKRAWAGSGTSDEEDKDLVQCLQHSVSGSEADSDSVSSHRSFNRSESDNERNSEYHSDGDKDDETSAGSDYNDDDSDGHGDNHDICDPNYTQNSGRGCFSQFEQEEQWKKEDPPRDESDERNSFKKERTTERTSSTVDPDVMEYIYSSKYKADFDCFLEDKGISHFEWEPGAVLAYFECHEQKRDECLKALYFFLSNVQKSDIPIEEVFWDCVKAKLPEIRSKLGNTNRPIIKIHKTEEMKLQIVSYVSDIGQHIKSLNEELDKVKKEAANACETFSFTSNYNPKDTFLLLKKINFKVKHLQPKCKDVDVNFDEEKGEVRLRGPKAQVDTAKETFEMQEIVIEQKELQSHFSTYVLEFLKTKEVLEKVEKTFQEKAIEAIVLFDETSPEKGLSARVLGDSKEAIACIRELVAKKEVIVDDSDLRLTTTAEWLELCNNLRSEEGVFLQVSSSKNIYVVTGFAGKVANAVKRLQEFLCKNCKVDGDYDCRTESIREYIEEYCQAELLSIATNLEEFGVDFKKGENRMLYMAGRRKGLELAKTKLDELINSLVLRCFEERQPGLRKYVEEDRKGKQWMKTVEHNHKCVIKVEFFSEIVQGICCFVTSEGRSISCKIGDIVNEKVHAVVCPRGECTKAVLSTTCPAARPYSENLKNGQVSVSPGFNLPCKKIFFTKCSKWKGGDGEKFLRVVVRKSLEEVDKLKGTTIAFPAIGTGKREFPPAEAARIMLDETIRFFKENSATTVRDVRFILLRKNEKVIDAFTQELNRYQQSFGENKEQKHIASLGIQSGCRRSIKTQYVNVEVVDGDLTNEKSDAIVNIINSDMNMENAGEVSKAIARVCGESPKQECKQLGTQQAGSVVITSGGRLEARHIIHIIPASSEPRHLQMCLEKCLEHADSKSFHTVSLPAIGTGEYELPPLISADLIFGALTRFSKECANLKNVRLVVNEAAMVDAFRQEKTKYKNSSTAAVSTNSKNHTLRFSLIGKDKESVDCAVEELKNDFSETCITKDVRDEVCEELTAAEIDMLVRKAENMGVEMTFEEVIDCVTLSGTKEDVFTMTEIIREKIDQVKKREKERQNQENAKLISNTIQWYYALPRGDNIPFDSSANLEIERAYCKCDDKVEVVDSCGEKFKISFQDNSGLKQPQNQQIKVTRKLKGVEGICLPQDWDQMPRDRDVHLVSLPKNCPEFGEVSQMFFATVEGVTITSIKRIQNPWLYQTYILTKEKVDKNNGGKNERRLFHATSFARVKFINSQGFKRNQNREHGTRYGKGVYFARDASKSLPYADPAGGQRYMYVARVLFGRYCQGEKEMKAPPPINSTGRLYDSTVDKPVDPEIFVIFHDTQCYPEYLITFE